MTKCMHGFVRLTKLCLLNTPLAELIERCLKLCFVVVNNFTNIFRAGKHWRERERERERERAGERDPFKYCHPVCGGTFLERGSYLSGKGLIVF